MSLKLCGHPFAILPLCTPNIGAIGSPISNSVTCLIKCHFGKAGSSFYPQARIEHESQVPKASIRPLDLRIRVFSGAIMFSQISFLLFCFDPLAQKWWNLSATKFQEKCQRKLNQGKGFCKGPLKCEVWSRQKQPHKYLIKIN